MRQVVYIRKNGEPSGAVTPSAAMVVARMRVQPGEGPFKLERDGKPGPELDRATVLERLSKGLKASDVGDRFRVLDKHGEYVFKVHAVQPELVVVDIAGNDKADVFYSWVIQTFQEYHPRYAGSYVCKEIANSWQLSQHSYGNAVDFFFDTLMQQDAVFNQAIAKADELHVHTLISRNTIWTRAEGKHYYTGEYHSHLHADFDPQQSGSCGVKG